MESAWFSRTWHNNGRTLFQRTKRTTIIIIIIIIIIITITTIIIIEFPSFQIQLGNIHLSWDVAINRIRLGGFISSLESFLQLNIYQELEILAFVCTYWDAS
jgi:hypothetical protein